MALIHGAGLRALPLELQRWTLAVRFSGLPVFFALCVVLQLFVWLPRVFLSFSRLPLLDEVGNINQ